MAADGGRVIGFRGGPSAAAGASFPTARRTKRKPHHERHARVRLAGEDAGGRPPSARFDELLRLVVVFGAVACVALGCVVAVSGLTRPGHLVFGISALAAGFGFGAMSLYFHDDLRLRVRGFEIDVRKRLRR